MKSLNLNDKNIWVTGAAGRIGSATCVALTEQGANVHAIDIVSKEAIQNDCPNCEATSLDITEENLVRSFAKENENVDIVIHLAGQDAKFDEETQHSLNMDQMSLEQWRKTVDTNLNGTFIICREALKIMKKRRAGNIILTPSLYSYVSPNPMLYQGEQVKPADYVASKSALPMLVKYIATHYGPHGIRANAFVPHGVGGEFDPQFRSRFESLTALKRMPDINEVIDPILFLASNWSSYMTGQSLIIDGGWSAL